MAQNFKVRPEGAFVVVEFDQNDSKVNVLSSDSLNELDKILRELRGRQDIKGLCVASAKPDTFIAGADIKEIEKITSAEEGEAKSQAGQKILNMLEALPFPTVALINGACLGGGLELALACDYRLATFSDKVRMGLPEVKLGLIPGFGGTKRLPGIVGLRKGLEMILSGEALSAANALRFGLVEGLFPQSRLMAEGMEFLRTKGKKRAARAPKLKGWLNIFLEKSFIGRRILARQSRAFVIKATRGRYPAPLAAIDVVIKNYNSPLGDALARESKVFGELVIGTVAKNLIHVFHLVEKYRKAQWVEAPPRPIKKCGLLGAGVMGGGIAHLFSSRGIPVRMKDLNYQALGLALRKARELYHSALKRKKLRTHQAVTGMGLISPTVDYSGFSNAGLIVEAVVEDMKIKKMVWNEVNSASNGNAIFATNTSCLSVAEMSEGVKNKERVCGMHFFNPVHRMPLVEIIRTSGTSDETISTVVEFSKKLGKTPIVVKDSCGFLVNRILIPYLNEAGFLLEEGARFERIDKVALDFGLPMGPFILCDEIGLDVGYKVAAILAEKFGTRMKVAEILKKVYEQKWFGKKCGKGFYIHQSKKMEPNRAVYQFLHRKESPHLSDAQILNRMIFRMINEAAICLEEGVAGEPSDVDIGMMMGTGFPPFRAGLLKYADSIGLENILTELNKFESETKGGRFVPCPYLVRMAEKREKFFK